MVQRLMTIVFTVILLIFALSVVLVFNLNSQVNNLGAMSQLRYESYQAADELRQSSDELTRFGRTYVATGNQQYKKMYNDVLAIRAGNKSRPEGYEGIYWDLVLNYGDKPKQDGAAQALQTRMRELGFSEKEFALLQQAENNSNQLVELEVAAMKIIDNPAHSEQQQLDAINLLNGTKYHQEKSRVMVPINEFFQTLEQRTKTQYETAMASVAQLVMLTTLVVSLGILCCIIGFIFVKTKITTPISTISQELLNINKSKDLTSRLSDTSQSEIGIIAKNFNELLQLFQSSYKAINTATNQVGVVTEVVTTLARDSSQQATSQMEELEMAAVAIEQMTTALASVSESTQNAEVQAAKSEDHVDSGLRLFSVAVDEMRSLSTNLAHNSALIQALSDESKNVGNVLDVIKAIAEQTNLLALNAAIEAARAGEQGRGFAVVADEVRTLAQRTSQSTKEIEQMIANLQQKSEQTRSAINDSNSLMLSTQEKVQQASDSLSEIGNASAEIHNLNTSIAAATEEQLAVSSEISSNITRVKDLSLNMKTAITGLPTKLNELSNSMAQLVKISAEFKV